MTNIDYIKKVGQRAIDTTKFVKTDDASEESFKVTLEFAIRYARKYNKVVAIFKNFEGTYVDRELAYCDRSITDQIRFVVLPQFVSKKK